MSVFAVDLCFMFIAISCMYCLRQ